MNNKKIVFTSFYKTIEDDIGIDDGGFKYGNLLLYPLVRLCEKLKSQGYSIYSSSQVNLNEADIAVFIDINKKMLKRFDTLNKNIKKILVCIESPIYAPESYNVFTIADSRWDAVLMWNKCYNSERIYHYDIPIAGIDAVGNYLKNYKIKEDKGVVVSSFKNDTKGNTLKRDHLYKKLAHLNLIDLYGLHWKMDIKNGIMGSTDNKLNTLEKYKYSLIIENSYYPGYVTEKLGDSILSGVPAIYAGDFEKAEERFPGTFIPLKDISVESFIEAKNELDSKYEVLCDNVEKIKKESNNWCESYYEAFFKALE